MTRHSTRVTSAPSNAVQMIKWDLMNVIEFVENPVPGQVRSSCQRAKCVTPLGKTLRWWNDTESLSIQNAHSQTECGKMRRKRVTLAHIKLCPIEMKINLIPYTELYIYAFACPHPSVSVGYARICYEQKSKHYNQNDVCISCVTRVVGHYTR